MLKERGTEGKQGANRGLTEDRQVKLSNNRYFGLALVLLLFLGSSLISCRKQQELPEEKGREKIITEQSDSLIRIMSENGKKSYRFETQRMERYGFAKEPYYEFRKGIHIVTYNDSTQLEESSLVADYAIYFEKQDMWEAKGNVVATNEDGTVLETQQLFWNRLTEKIYSNVDSRLTQGRDVMVGVGFESDDKLKKWEFRRPRMRWIVNIEPTQDTTHHDGPHQAEKVESGEGAQSISEGGEHSKKGDEVEKLTTVEKDGKGKKPSQQSPKSPDKSKEVEPVEATELEELPRR